MERLESHHRARDPLDEAMILLEDIVQVFDLPDLDCAATAGAFQDHVYRPQTGKVGTALFNENPVSQAIRTDRLLEEVSGSCQIAALG